jgi:NAD-dependent SIR2 family protein deacetylase
MATKPASLGRCPSCDASIPDYRLLIEYERDDRPAAYAECPDCGDVVRPE